jgi:alkylated DNA repair dioxygenase AlkB
MPAPAPPIPARLPAGFRYDRGFLSADEEAELVQRMGGLDLQPAAYHEYTALRKTACFGLGISFDGPLAEARQTGRFTAAGLKLRPPAPQFLQELAAKVERFHGLRPGSFPHVLVTEYPPGAPIGWHRDAPPFAAIYGVSLAAACSFRLRPYVSPLERGQRGPDDLEAAVLGLRAGPRTASARGGARAGRPAHGAPDGMVKLTVEPRSLYVMAGPARSAWQHSIAPVKATRYSITLRTL